MIINAETGYVRLRYLKNKNHLQKMAGGFTSSQNTL
jgi:hypothetical protein